MPLADKNQPRRGLAGELDRRFRPEWRTMSATAPIYETFLDVTAVWSDVQDQRQQITASGRYSAAGVLSELRNYARSVSVPTLDSNVKRLEGYAERVNARRASLTVPKPDPSDLLGALLRQEARAYMRGLSKGELVGLMLGSPDTILLQAAFEAPAALVNRHFDADLRTKVETAYIAAAHADKLPILEAQQEALHLAGVALQKSVESIAEATGFRAGSREFDAWMQEASGSSLPSTGGLKDGALKEAVMRADQRQDFERWMREEFEKGGRDASKEHDEDASATPKEEAA
jgi:hypothetical protein